MIALLQFSFLFFTLFSYQDLLAQLGEGEPNPNPTINHNEDSSPSTPPPISSSLPAAFPMDKPADTNDGGRAMSEVDLYLGPSYSNTDGWGIGFSASLFNQAANKESFGFKRDVGLRGGFYDEPGGGVEPQVVAILKLGYGYYSVEGLKNGYGPSALLDFLLFNLTYLGNGETMLSYTPALEFGLHGRVDKNATFWAFQIEPSFNIAYTNGSLMKLDDNGNPTHTLISPLLVIRAFTDLPLSPSHHLRCGIYIYDTFDSLGVYGSRSIIQISAKALVKFSSWFYTGPQFIYTNPEKVADISTKTYNPATPTYSISWLFGGAIPGF